MSQEEIIADVPNEGDVVKDSAFDRAGDNVEKTTSESQPEKKQTEKPSQGGEPEKDNTPEEKTPFHKHPRWIAQRKENEALKTQLDELNKKFQDVEPLLKERKAATLPDWWKNSYGETEDSHKAYQNYQQATQAERDRIKSEIVQELQQAQEQETKVQQEADEYVKTQLAEMKDEGIEFNENELMKFIVDFNEKYGPGSLLDSDGNYDFRKSLQLMQALNPKPQDNATDVKKRIASDTMRTKGVSSQKGDVPVLTRHALRRGNWRDAQ